MVNRLVCYQETSFIEWESIADKLNKRKNLKIGGIMSPDDGTYFMDEEGKSLGSRDGVLPIPLYKGMLITIHGYDGTFEVVDWNYHLGHPDEKGGLRIILKSN